MTRLENAPGTDEPCQQVNCLVGAAVQYCVLTRLLAPGRSMDHKLKKPWKQVHFGGGVVYVLVESFKLGANLTLEIGVQCMFALSEYMVPLKHFISFILSIYFFYSPRVLLVKVDSKQENKKKSTRDHSTPLDQRCYPRFLRCPMIKLTAQLYIWNVIRTKQPLIHPMPFRDLLMGS